MIARLFVDDQPQTVVLDCKEVYESHTRFFISSEIQECMKKFKIKPVQILSFVTDTARNMKAGVRIASTELEMKAKEDQFDENEVEHPFNDSFDEIDFEVASPVIEIDDINIEIGNHTDDFPYVFDIDCAAHVLQLGVNDFLKSKVNY